MRCPATNPSESGTTPMFPSGRCRLGTLAIDRVTFARAIDAIESLVERRRGGFVVTPNVDHVVIADRREDFRVAYAAADLSLA